MNRKTSFVISSSILLVAIAIMLVFILHQKEPDFVEEEEPPRLVKTLPLKYSTEQVQIHCSGFISSQRLDIVPIKSGYLSFVKENLKSGTKVDEGTLLFSVDDRRAKLAFKGARSRLVQITLQYMSQAGLESDSGWTNYVKSLKSASPDSLPKSPEGSERQTLLAVTMGVDEARCTFELAAFDLLDHYYYAPFTGEISGAGAYVGQWVNPGENLASLVDMSTFEITTKLPLKQQKHVAIGDTVTLCRLEDGLSCQGVIVSCSHDVGINTQSFPIRIEFQGSEDSSWYPGSYVEAEIGGQIFENIYSIPRDYLVGNRLALLQDGKLHLEDISILAISDDSVFIEPHLPQGSEYIVTKIQVPIEGLALQREEFIEVEG